MKWGLNFGNLFVCINDGHCALLARSRCILGLLAVQKSLDFCSELMLLKLCGFPFNVCHHFWSDRLTLQDPGRLHPSFPRLGQTMFNLSDTQ